MASYQTSHCYSHTWTYANRRHLIHLRLLSSRRYAEKTAKIALMSESVNLDEFLANISIHSDKFQDVQSYMDSTGALVYKPKLVRRRVYMLSDMLSDIYCISTAYGGNSWI